jgi:hypothetical protein
MTDKVGAAAMGPTFCRISRPYTQLDFAENGASSDPNALRRRGVTLPAFASLLFGSLQVPRSTPPNSSP